MKLRKLWSNRLKTVPWITGTLRTAAGPVRLEATPFTSEIPSIIQPPASPPQLFLLNKVRKERGGEMFVTWLSWWRSCSCWHGSHVSNVGMCESVWVCKHGGLCVFTHWLRGSVKMDEFFKSLPQTIFSSKRPSDQGQWWANSRNGKDFVILWSGTDLGEFNILHICAEGPETGSLS